jgi:hypothetical protein
LSCSQRNLGQFCQVHTTTLMWLLRSHLILALFEAIRAELIHHKRFNDELKRQSKVTCMPESNQVWLTVVSREPEMSDFVA